MFLRRFAFGPLRTNAFLFACEETKVAAAIDPSAGSTKALLDQLKQWNVTLDKILLTHSHWDHIADVYSLKQATGAAVFVHEADRANLAHPGSDGLPLLLPISGVEPEFLLQDGEKIWVGRIEIEVIHTPGHSPGGVCFSLASEKILFSGDTLFRGTIGNIHLPTSEPSKMRKSLERLAILPPHTRVFPGHGAETTIQAEASVLGSLKK